MSPGGIPHVVSMQEFSVRALESGLGERMHEPSIHRLTGVGEVLQTPVPEAGTWAV